MAANPKIALHGFYPPRSDAAIGATVEPSTATDGAAPQGPPAAEAKLENEPKPEPQFGCAARGSGGGGGRLRGHGQQRQQEAQQQQLHDDGGEWEDVEARQRERVRGHCEQRPCGCWGHGR
ncbi:hypothetical protein N2152v2_005532 [Parachlorella kessleri]